MTIEYKLHKDFLVSFNEMDECITKVMTKLRLYVNELKEKENSIESREKSMAIKELNLNLETRLLNEREEKFKAIQNEMAMTLEDVMARRTRMLFLNVKAAINIAPKVAGIMANQMDKDQHWINQQVEQFTQVSKNY